MPVLAGTFSLTFFFKCHVETVMTALLMYVNYRYCPRSSPVDCQIPLFISLNVINKAGIGKPRHLQDMH